jgi:hypothetical protein
MPKPHKHISDSNATALLDEHAIDTEVAPAAEKRPEDVRIGDQVAYYSDSYRFDLGGEENVRLRRYSEPATVTKVSRSEHGVFVDLEIERVAREVKCSPIDSRHQTPGHIGAVGHWSPFGVDGSPEHDARKRSQYLPEVGDLVALYVHEPVKPVLSERFGPNNFSDMNRGANVVPVAARVIKSDGWYVDLEYKVTESITNVVFANDDPSDRTWGWVELAEGGEPV